MSKVTPAYQLFNVGNGSPESLLDFVKAIENAIGLEANKNFSPMQPGDVSRTWADITDLEKLGYKSSVGMNEGVIKFVEWYRQFLNSKVKNDQIDRPT
ncbi:hypothetical protein LCGC14_2734110 [marine sediment metagenome]|uniref:NAD(P)-binding domain-containing protein n=1 Tax=marine sediment metagenome TaxID=412755 RepID=A0A0F9BFB0_9ZZZZ